VGGGTGNLICTELFLKKVDFAVVKPDLHVSF
jgi:hypothetical protein